MTSKMDLNVIYNEDCIVGMRNRIKDDSVDLIVTDPPFAIDFSASPQNYNRDSTKVIDSYHEVLDNEYYQFTHDWMSEAYRVLKKSGSMYVFSGWNHLEDILRCLRELNFYTVNHIIWKYQFGVNCTKRFISSHYHILYVCKNENKREFNTYARYGKNDVIPFTKRNARYSDMEDVWIINRENWPKHMKTATKLPREIIEKILSYSGKKGDLVVDPFVGCGQVAFVAKNMDMNYIAFEISNEAYNLSKLRLDKNQYLIKQKELIY